MKNEKNKNVARTIPHSIEAEQSVLGCCLIDDNAVLNIMTLVKVDDFYTNVHKTIFECMLDIYSLNKPIDYVTLTDDLERKGLLESIGGIDYITTLTNIVPSAVNYKHYVDIVKNDSVLRQLITAGQDIINKSYEDINREDALSFAEQNIFSIGEKDERGGLTHINVAVNNTISNFETLQNNKGSIRGVPSGIYGIDKITNGFQKGALILIAARPGCGKTSLGMNMINHAAVKCGKKCAIFSLEMSKEEIAARSICSLAYVDMGKALKGEMNDKEWKAVLSASKKLSESNIYIDEGFSKSPMDILSKCRKLKREKGLDILMIDYLQLMKSERANKDGNRQQEVAELTRSIKLAARELGVPILLLSQLNRESEKRADKTPQLSDLRESGSIEQDADIVMFISDVASENASDSSDDALDYSLVIAKHRNGMRGTIPIKWKSEFTQFYEPGKDNLYTKNTSKVQKEKDVVLTPMENSEIEDIFKDE